MFLNIPYYNQLSISDISFCQKEISENIPKRKVDHNIRPTTLLQILCELIINSKVSSISILSPDDSCEQNHQESMKSWCLFVFIHTKEAIEFSMSFNPFTRYVRKLPATEG